MDIEELIKLANDAYPDNLILSYFEDPNTNHGDLLARFIARELVETFEDRKSKKGQLVSAIHVLETSKRELQSVIDALENEIDR